MIVLMSVCDLEKITITCIVSFGGCDFDWACGLVYCSRSYRTGLVGYGE